MSVNALPWSFREPEIVREAPRWEIHDGRYILRFARGDREIDAILKLRFEIFNLELREGLEASFETGRDEDEFDEACDHLAVYERASGRVIGAYRMQTLSRARDHRGFYTDTEFDLSDLPAGVLEYGVELGRACIARDHRNSRVLLLLWRGLARFMSRSGLRYLFGCCSLTSQDPEYGRRAAQTLVSGGHVHPSIDVAVRREFECGGGLERAGGEPVVIPRLFQAYLRYGAKVCGGPAIDRRFKTIDFLVLMDIHALDAWSRRVLFRS